MVIKPPPYIYQREVPEPEDECNDVTEDKNIPQSEETSSLDEKKQLPKCSCASRICPPRGRAANILTICVILVTLWAVSYCVLGEVALPGINQYNVSTLD